MGLGSSHSIGDGLNVGDDMAADAESAEGRAADDATGHELESDIVEGLVGLHAMVMDAYEIQVVGQDTSEGIGQGVADVAGLLVDEDNMAGGADATAETKDPGRLDGAGAGPGFLDWSICVPIDRAMNWSIKSPKLKDASLLASSSMSLSQGGMLALILVE